MNNGLNCRMVERWIVIFALNGQEKIELTDVATLVDWQPEFKGEYMAKFFGTDYSWTRGLAAIERFDGEKSLNIPIKNFFMCVSRKWKGGVPLGILFEFTEGDLKLRGVGPPSLTEKAGGDSNLLLQLVDELFEKPDLWKTKIVISAKSKAEWKKLSEIVGAQPWALIEQGRNIIPSNPKKAMENFETAYQVFNVLNDTNGQFHALYALTELALDTQNTDYARGRLEALWALANQLGDPMLEENILTVEGILLYEDKLYEQSIAKFEQALERAKRANIHSAVVNAYCNIGECYYRVQRFSEASENFDKARRLAEERNDKRFLAISQANLGKVLTQQVLQNTSSETQARFYLDEGLQLFEQLTSESGMMEIYGIYAQLEANLQNFEASFLYYEKAAEKARNYHLKEYYLHRARSMKDRLI